MKKIFEKIKSKKKQIIWTLCIFSVLTCFSYVASRTIMQMVVKNALLKSYQEPLVASESYDKNIVGQVEGVSRQTAKKPPETKTVFKSEESKPTAKINFSYPVDGAIINKFSNSELVFSKTFEDWRVHQGIDIKGKLSDAIKAAAEGVIDTIDYDPQKGITVTIKHPNGFKTVYSNLASDKLIKTGQNVKKGDLLGAIGETAIFEAAEEPHVHFEALNDKNELIDPETLFSQ